ncbi:hypothetical protein [Helcococcus sueciensis]|uniref:hypothetical protein n=1 Tax=Helcococcus sueciensis TaxID=241555 RepID=UPI00040C3D93|nr:hypothetical protein [Helcococcus sueciensis]
MSKMYHIENSMLQPSLKYKLLSSSIIPRPVAWITSFNSENELINITMKIIKEKLGYLSPVKYRKLNVA